MIKKILKLFERNRYLESPKDRKCPYCKKPLMEEFGFKTPNCPKGLTVCPDFHYVEHVDAEGHTWTQANGGTPLAMSNHITEEVKEELL